MKEEEGMGEMKKREEGVDDTPCRLRDDVVRPYDTCFLCTLSDASGKVSIHKMTLCALLPTACLN